MTERTKNINVALIHELWNEYAAASNAADLERWLALWAEDGLRVPPSEFGPRQFGRDEIRAVMQPLFESFAESKITINPEGIDVLGSKAYSYGTFELYLVPRDEGEPQTVNGNFLTILVKLADGSWKIAIDTWNR